MSGGMIYEEEIEDLQFEARLCGLIRNIFRSISLLHPSGVKNRI